MSAVAARLERLPLSGFHRKLLIIGGLGYMFDGLDSSSLAFLLPVVSKLWSLTSAQTGLVASSTYIGYFFGAFLSGVLADIIGRRRIMMSGMRNAASRSHRCLSWARFRPPQRAAEAPGKT
jgi:putative MFS transporter